MIGRNALLVAVALAAAGAATTPAHAQNTVRMTPLMGEVRTVSVGSAVWEEYRYVGDLGAVIERPVRANWGSLETVDLPAGSGLVVLREKKLKACATQNTFPNLGVTMWSSCLFDLDNDGRFEKVSYSSTGASKAVDPPVPYRRDVIEMVGQNAPPSNKKVVLYLGGDATSLKLSYREFANSMARPAFTEDLSIPLTATYPQTIAVKDRVIELLGITGMGLQYRVMRQAQARPIF